MPGGDHHSGDTEVARIISKSVGQGASTHGPLTTPTLSVVLPVLGPVESLGAVLAMLVPRCSSLHAELVVVLPAESAVPRHLPHAFPGVRFVKAPAEASTPVGLRAFGARHASGDLLAIRSDLAVGDMGWLAPFGSIVQAHRGDPSIPASPLAGPITTDVEVPLDGIVH